MNDRITLRFLAEPSDGVPTNAAHTARTISAGSVLDWIDKAGYACAVGWSASACVTASVGNVHFPHPIAPGQLIEVEARVIHTGRSSIHIRVTVAAADARDGRFTEMTHCILVFVALDDNGAPQSVPQWQPHSIEDLELAAGASGRSEARAEIHTVMREQQYTDAGTGPRMLFRFLGAPSGSPADGNVHGGTVMRWIDDAAATCATAWSTHPTVAVYSGGIHFYTPIHRGDIVEVEARLIHTGAHSMHLAIHVSSGDPRSAVRELITQCMNVFVSIGPDGRARTVEALPLESEEDRQLDAHARILIGMRADLRALPIPGTL